MDQGEDLKESDFTEEVKQGEEEKKQESQVDESKMKDSKRIQLTGAPKHLKTTKWSKWIAYIQLTRRSFHNLLLNRTYKWSWWHEREWTSKASNLVTVWHCPWTTH